MSVPNEHPIVPREPGDVAPVAQVAQLAAYDTPYHGKREWLLKQYALFPWRLLRYAVRVFRDPGVAPGWKWRYLLVLLYLASPIDLIPDFFLPFGLVDDAYLLLLSLDNLLRRVPAETFSRCWVGDPRVVRLMGRLLRLGRRVLPGPIGRTVDRFFGDSEPETV